MPKQRSFFRYLGTEAKAGATGKICKSIKAKPHKFHFVELVSQSVKKKKKKKKS
jgi:hypothetical protein